MTTSSDQLQQADTKEQKVVSVTSIDMCLDQQNNSKESMDECTEQQSQAKSGKCSQEEQIYENTEVNFKSNEEKESDGLLNDEDVLAMQECIGLNELPPEYESQLNETISRVQKERQTLKSEM